MKTYTVKQVADLLETNPETVRRWIRSGKLEAIKGSRKSGSVIYEDMLEAFLKAAPKYKTIATASTVATAAASAAIAIPAGIAAKLIIDNENIKKSLVSDEDLIKFISDMIEDKKKLIAQKQEGIKQLETEISLERKNINELLKLIKKATR